jgi:CRISPR-associated endoribonuclease Cas6
MRLKLTLQADEAQRGDRCIPINYQYPLSAAIYKIISHADSRYAAFLHEWGYHQKDSLKAFKLFTFSDLSTPFRIVGDRLVLQTGEACLTVCFHIPEAAAYFIQGLFLNQRMDIADSHSRVSFLVRQVEEQPLWHAPVLPEAVQTVQLKPLSPLVVGVTNEKGHYTFLYPSDAQFVPALTFHIREKYRAVYGDEDTHTAFDGFDLQVWAADKAQSRLLTVKAGTPAETKIRGFKNFRLQMTAQTKIIELLLNSGAGVYNAMGCGCLALIQNSKFKIQDWLTPASLATN